MARYRCPACGSPYDGKRCKECCYEPFTEEVAHGNHYHAGEPLVLEQTPPRRPIRPDAPRPCSTFPGRQKARQKKKLPVLLRILLIILVLSWGLEFLFGLVGSLMLRDSVSGFTAIYAEPEPEFIAPADGTVLYDENDILVIADWRDGETCTGSIPVYVRNNSAQDISVTAGLLSVNGYMTNNSFLYCHAYAGEEAMDTLWLDAADLEEAGIEAVSDITFRLDIYDAETYEDVVVTDFLTLRTSAAATSRGFPEYGTVLYAENGLEFAYIGHTGETCEEGALRFALRNSTDRCLQVYISQPRTNGQDCGLYFWQELAPGTWTIAFMDLYPLEELGLGAIADIHTLEFVLGASDPDDWDFWLQSEVLTLSPEGA